MSELAFSLLDTADPQEVMHFEACLFKAFYPLHDPSLSIIWDFDRERQRIHMRIPYSAQEIYVARWNGAIIAAAALNFDMQSPLQLEMFGFSIDKTLPGSGEGLVLFSMQVLAGMSPVLLQLGDFVHAALLKKKIIRIYGTCSLRLLKGYQMLGFSVIDRRAVGSTEKFLLEKSVATRESGFHLNRT